MQQLYISQLCLLSGVLSFLVSLHNEWSKQSFVNIWWLFGRRFAKHILHELLSFVNELLRAATKSWIGIKNFIINYPIEEVSVFGIWKSFEALQLYSLDRKNPFYALEVHKPSRYNWKWIMILNYVSWHKSACVDFYLVNLLLSKNGMDKPDL